MTFFSCCKLIFNLCKFAFKFNLGKINSGINFSLFLPSLLLDNYCTYFSFEQYMKKKITFSTKRKKCRLDFIFNKNFENFQTFLLLF